MKSFRYPVLTATVGLWLAHAFPAFAQQVNAPAPLALYPDQPLPAASFAAVNQHLANTIAAQLRQSGQLRHYNVDIRAENGAVELTGQVTDQMQREEVLRIVQGIPGVERVRDRLDIIAIAVTPALAQQVMPEPRQLPSTAATPMPPQTNGLPAEPLAIFRAPPMPAGLGGATNSMPPPPMPPYAWPTYAPYNNVSRVAYPDLYPAQSWPFIGPMYPYPKVPLGWRSIELKWMDGHWWYGRTATGHDWWRVRYW